MKSKSKKYLKGIEWIAFNDEPEEFDLEIISSMLTVVLLSEVFNISPEDIAQDILKYRKNI